MSAFTHLARSVLGARYFSGESLFAMFTFYADESGDQWCEDGKLHDFTFVCGYIASVEQWERFEIDWRLFLAKYDVTAFHMKHFAHSVGEFTKWKDNKWKPTRDNFMADAAEIIRGVSSHGFVAFLSQSIFDQADRKFKLKEACGTPYGVAGRVCADLVRSWGIRNGIDPCDLEYVFEARETDKGGLMRAMTQLRPLLPSPIFKPGKDQKPTKKCPDGKRAVVQLQSADYLVYEIHKMFTDQVKQVTGRAIRKSFTAIAGIPTAKESLTDTALECFCTRYRIERRDA